MALLFINKVGGSRRGLSIRLSGIFTYPAGFWNQGVRIIEVLLYNAQYMYRSNQAHLIIIIQLQLLLITGPLTIKLNGISHTKLLVGVVPGIETRILKVKPMKISAERAL